MKTQARSGGKSSSVLIPEEFERRPFAVRALTVLLILQAVTFVIIGVVAIEWRQGLIPIIINHAVELSYLVMAVLDLIAAMGFVRLRPASWLIAMLIQGLYLLLSLIDYVVNRPETFAFYSLMALSVLIVIYLNYAEVPALFLRWRLTSPVNRISAQNSAPHNDFSDQSDL